MYMYICTCIYVHVCSVSVDEGHFNANVQERRTARHDVSVAKDMQKEEILDYRQQQSQRREELRQR